MINKYTNSNGVFINKFGISDAKLLETIEYDLVERKAQMLLAGRVDLGVSTTYGLKRLAAIHKYLFEEVYEWAGKLRTVPLFKARK